MFRRSISLNVVAVCLSLLCGTYPTFAEEGTKCKCISHQAEAEATGTCSRTEDDTYCTLVFTTTQPKEYNDFVTRLQSLGLEIDPREALQIAYKYPPNNLNAEQLKGILPVLFAISQRTHFQYLTPEITKIFSGDISQIFEPYRKEGKSVIKTNVGNFNATISYGCMELSRGKVFTMVKTRWSKAEFFCDDFPK